MKTRKVPGRELTSRSLLAEDYVDGGETMLTVDWDYFVPEDPMWDIGHRENEMFLNWIWQTRFGLLDKMKTTGEEVAFWERLRSAFNFSGRLRVFVSDSHAHAWLPAQTVDRIVLFDAHHDCWERTEEGKVHCHDWLRCWVDSCRTNKAFWVPPLWVADKASDDNSVLFPLPKDMLSTVEFAHPEYGSLTDPVCFCGERTIDVVHICRSGCWTPPWLDLQFIQFVRSLTEPLSIVPIKLDSGAWDPLVERWSDGDMAQAKQFEQMTKEGMAALDRARRHK